MSTEGGCLVEQGREVLQDLLSLLRRDAILFEIWFKQLIQATDRYRLTGDVHAAVHAEYELSGLNREEMVHTVDKELVECELCGSAIAPRDHLRWIYRRLGAHAYSNVTVSLVAQEDLGLRDAAPEDQRPLNRADIQRVLCPSCRRGVTLLDEWGPVS